MPLPDPLSSERMRFTMDHTSCETACQARGTIAPRRKQGNQFTQPPDEAYQVLTGVVLRLFLHLKARTRFARYCDDTYADYAAALGVEVYTIKYAIKALRKTMFPGASYGFISVQKVGLRCRIYPVDKGGNCMLPPEPDGETGSLQSTAQATPDDRPALAPLFEAHASGIQSEKEPENVNVAVRGEAEPGSLGEADAAQLGDQVEQEPAAAQLGDQVEQEPAPVEDLAAQLGDDADLATLSDAELEAVIAGSGRHGRKLWARIILRNRRMSDAQVNPRIPADPNVERVATPPAPTEVSGPVTFETLVRRLQPDASEADRKAAVRHLADKLEGGLRKSIGFYTKVVNAIVAGQYERRKIYAAFMHAMKSIPEKRGGRFAADIKPYPWAPFAEATDKRIQRR
jgi:hypothetical protein